VFSRAFRQFQTVGRRKKKKEKEKKKTKTSKEIDKDLYSLPDIAIYTFYGTFREKLKMNQEWEARIGQ